MMSILHREEILPWEELQAVHLVIHFVNHKEAVYNKGKNLLHGKWLIW